MRARVLLVLINLLSLGCLLWTLRDAKLGELRGDLATMDWAWVALAVVADIVVYLVQAYRWSLLLRPVEPIGFWRTARAIYIGLFANEVLPLRAGEVLRCYLLSIWTKASVFGGALQRFDRANLRRHLVEVCACFGGPAWFLLAAPAPLPDRRSLG